MKKSRVEFCGMTFTPKEFTLELPPFDLNDIPHYVHSIHYPLSVEAECVMEGTINAPLLQKLTGVPMDLIDDFTVQFSEPYQEQVRRHKKKRIDKKWAKRYGYRTKTRIRTIENVRIKQRGHDEFEFTGLNIFKEKLYE